MTTDTLDIQKLVQESGVARRTIYFYVQQGIIPPPEGAGLAAYYTGEHLLRLQMIPLLRREGLRLDEIRERLAGMTPDEMKRRLADAALPVMRPRSPVGPGGPVGPHGPYAMLRRGYVHYSLPDGVTLIAPGDLSGSGELRLRRLLEAAARIYQAPDPLGPGDGRTYLDQDKAEEE